MKKAWSISTTLRNPERFISFLKILKQLEGEIWDVNSQKKFQILLIQNRLYGFGSNQFLNSLSKQDADLITNINKPISYEKAEEIFNLKNYEDSAMRGRQSINPLKKLGFVSIVDSRIVINEVANRLIAENYDLGDVFFHCFLKWQIPNPQSKDYKIEDGYDIIPFIGTLKLFAKLKAICTVQGIEFKGLTKEEFNYYVPTLINYSTIDSTAESISEIRTKAKKYKGTEKRQFLENCYLQHVKDFFSLENDKEIKKMVRNLRDYGDNILRYYRLTRYFYLRGNGYYIDVEPRRIIEINELLKNFSGQSLQFPNLQTYNLFLQDFNKPELPWQKTNQQKEIITQIKDEIEKLVQEYEIEGIQIKPVTEETNHVLEKYIDYLRSIRKDVQSKILYKVSQSIDQLIEYIKSLKEINKHPNKSLELEKLVSYGMYALNDALRIIPNYPVGDDYEPIYFAPANKPDIECYYDTFNAICEVTMLKSRDQWFNEGQPVMRHLRDFENENNKETYCIFIAPTLHRDTLNTFWIAVKYEYEGSPQNIIPLTISDFICLLEKLVELKSKNIKLSHIQIKELFKSIIGAAKNENSVTTWFEKIPVHISAWGSNLLGNKNEN